MPPQPATAIAALTIDCSDAKAMVRFYNDAFGGSADPAFPNVGSRRTCHWQGGSDQGNDKLGGGCWFQYLVGFLASASPQCSNPTGLEHHGWLVRTVRKGNGHRHSVAAALLPRDVDSGRGVDEVVLSARLRGECATLKGPHLEP